MKHLFTVIAYFISSIMLWTVETQTDFAKVYELLLQEEYEKSIQPISEKYIEKVKVALILESIEPSESHKGGMGHLRLINPTEQSIYIIGYNVNNPWFYWEQKKGKNWESIETGLFCGTGLQDWEIPAGKSAVMSIQIPREINRRDIKIGVVASYIENGFRSEIEVCTSPIKRGANKSSILGELNKKKD